MIINSIARFEARPGSHCTSVSRKIFPRDPTIWRTFCEASCSYPEAKVWVAESNDIPLVTEAPTVEALLAKLPDIIQDLLEDERDGQEVEVPFEFCARFSERLRIRSRIE